jgi:hypothetical protein
MLLTPEEFASLIEVAVSAPDPMCPRHIRPSS